MRFTRIRKALRFTPRNGLLTFLAAVILWNEYLALTISSLFWITPNQSGKQYSILIVSDPQLIGYRDEAAGIGWISRWDSDRYLRRGFEAAVAAAQPHLILFMGDLFDEGVKMSSQEFEWTLNRFEIIFPHIKKIPTIYIPGDNDIGGEMEPIYDRLVTRFDRIFANSLKKLDHFAIEHLDFASIKPLEPGKFASIIKANKPRVKILLSHIPLLRSLSRGDFQTIQSYSPDLILTAHDHTAELYIRNRTNTQYQRFPYKTRLDFLISSKHPIIEIQNPTVSYRMGVADMGYGVLTLYDEDPLAAVFTVYWMPGRYPQLFFYIISIILTVYFFLRPWIGLSSEKLVQLAKGGRKNIV